MVYQFDGNAHVFVEGLIPHDVQARFADSPSSIVGCRQRIVFNFPLLPMKVHKAWFCVDVRIAEQVVLVSLSTGSEFGLFNSYIYIYIVKLPEGKAH